MSTDTAATPPPAEAAAAPPRENAVRRARLVDLTAFLAFGLAGVYLVSGLYPDPFGLHVAANRQDSVQLQWLLLHATRLFTHGEDPLFTTLVNAPFGVNLMANTSILAFALPLAPITLAFGPSVSALILLTLAPAATAAAWYHVLSRHLVSSRFGAFVGALFAGFAPAMVSHDTGHPNIVAQFVLPLIVLTVLRIRIPGRRVRTGLELAALVVLQVFINEELLFLTALTLLIFLLFLLAFARDMVVPHIRSALIVAGITAGVGGAILAYPLYRQFFGPMAYSGLPTFVLDYGNNLSSFAAFSYESFAGPSYDDPNLTEQNAFYGIPLVLLLFGIVIAFRRSPVVRSLWWTAVVLSVLSLGRTITVGNNHTGIAGPWTLLADLPIFEAVVPTRLTLFVTPIIAILLAMAIARLRSIDMAAELSRFGRRWGWSPTARTAQAARWTGIGVVIAALVPIAPTPIDVAANVENPRFFTSGAWENVISPDSTVLALPLDWDGNVDVMQWQVAVDLAFSTPGGYYLAPSPTGSNRRAAFGPHYVTTVTQLTQVASTGRASEVTVTAEEAREDLEFWAVDIILVPDSASHASALCAAVTDLVGEGTHIEDMSVWTIADLAS